MTTYGQASVDEPNSLTTSFAYSFAPSGRLLIEDDVEIPNVKIFAHGFVLDATYATPAPGLAVDASLTMMGVKLGSGSFNHFPQPGKYDDGDFHLTPTDFRIGPRYQLKFMEEFILAAVHAAVTIPTHDYPTFGLTAPGRGLKQLNTGVSVARTLDPILPALFLAGRYEYSFVERVESDDPDTEDYPRNYSDITANLGYFILDDLMIAAAFNARLSHGGLKLIDYPFVSDEVKLHHDQLIDEDAYFLGGDVGYSVTEVFRVNASARFFLTGENTRNQNIYGVSASYDVF